MTARDLALRRRARRRSALEHHAAISRRRGAVLAFSLAFFFVATPLIAVTLFGVQRYHAIAETVGPAEEVIAQMPRGGARVYDRNGTLLYEFVDEYGGLRRPVPLERMSDWIQQAIIATEDADFYRNRGVNVRGLLRAGAENITPVLTGEGDFFAGSGGSSITQQLAKNVYIPPERRTERSVDRKLQELVVALELTDRYSKDQILEWYLNSISFGGLYVGIEAAAQGYFGKPAAELTLGEAALLAGVPQSPVLYDPLSSENLDPETRQPAPAGLAKQRQGEVLSLMVHHGMITAEQAEEAVGEAIEFRERSYAIEAAHFVLGRVASEINARFGERAVYEQGLEVTTTLDLELQQIAEEIIERYLAERGDPVGLRNGALMAMDPRSSEILVYVGSRDYFSEEILGPNDNVMGRNSPGSTLKPFGYMEAFMRGWGTGTAILDTPLTISDPTGAEFTPTNPGNVGFQGPIRADRALGNSLNVSAIRMVQEVGVFEVIEMLKRVGYTTFDSPEGYGPALITGGSEVTLLDQVFAYSVLANQGLMRGQEAIATPNVDPDERALEPVAILRVEDGTGEVLYEFERPEEQEIVAPEYAYLVSHILNDPENFCLTYASCEAMVLPNGHPSAAKTGTSEPFADSDAIGDTWTIGYTPELVAGIWAGNTDNTPVRGVTSSTIALPAWKEFMVAAIAHLGLAPTPFERPPGVVEVEVCWPSGRLPTSHCPNAKRYGSLYAAEVIPSDPRQAPEMWDRWWGPDGRLMLPEDQITGWDGLLAWSAQHGVGVTAGARAAIEADGLLPAERAGEAAAEGDDDSSEPADVSRDGATEALPGRVTVGLTAREDSNVRVTVDGVVEFDGVLSAGQSGTWQGGQRIQVWTNRGRTLLLSVNGEDLGPYSPAMGHPSWNEINFSFTPA